MTNGVCKPMHLNEILKAVFFGIVEGITEWLPISSTGHLILLDEFIKLNASEEFKEMFFVVIQLGAILAVVVSFWKKLFPFYTENSGAIHFKKENVSLWGKILVACVPAAIIGLLFDDQINALFYNPQTVAFTLILYGVLFIIIENRQKNRDFKIKDVGCIDYGTALLIGVFQMLALIPGTSRSGATIVGALLIGVSRVAAAEFTFFLAVPVMFGASFLKIVKLGLPTMGIEVVVLLIGTVVAFFVSLFTIRVLIAYVKKRNFKVFGWYRIVLGVILAVYFSQ